MNDNPKFTEWLKESCENLAVLNPESMCFIGKTEKGSFTGYFNVSVDDLAVFASRLQAEITMDTIKGHAETLKAVLAACE